MPYRKPSWIARTYCWLTERLYNEFAWAYDPVSWLVSLGQWDTVRSWALDYCIGSKVLELGFGTGELLLEMARRRLDAYGMEYTSAMQRVTQRKMHRQDLCLPRVCGRTQHIPFAKSSFDTVISTFPANYILDPTTWAEAARVLRTPGRLVMVGLYVSATEQSPPLARWAFGLPSEPILGHIQQLASTAGMGLTTKLRSLPRLRLEVPVFLAEKNHTNPQKNLTQ